MDDGSQVSHQRLRLSTLRAPTRLTERVASGSILTGQRHHRTSDTGFTDLSMRAHRQPRLTAVHEVGGSVRVRVPPLTSAAAASWRATRSGCCRVFLAYGSESDS